MLFLWKTLKVKIQGIKKTMIKAFLYVAIKKTLFTKPRGMSGYFCCLLPYSPKGKKQHLTIIYTKSEFKFKVSNNFRSVRFATWEQEARKRQNLKFLRLWLLHTTMSKWIELAVIFFLHFFLKLFEWHGCKMCVLSYYLYCGCFVNL